MVTWDTRRAAVDTFGTRPFTPADLAAVDALDALLTPDTRYRRYFAGTSAIPPAARARLAHLARPHYDAVAGRLGDRLIGWAEYGAWPDRPDTVDIGVLVGDPWQRRGFGPRMVAAVIEVAAGRGFTHATATILPGHRAAMAALRRVRPDAVPRLLDGLLEFRFSLPIRPVMGQISPVIASAAGPAHRGPAPATEEPQPCLVPRTRSSTYAAT